MGLRRQGAGFSFGGHEAAALAMGWGRAFLGPISLRYCQENSPCGIPLPIPGVACPVYQIRRAAGWRNGTNGPSKLNAGRRFRDADSARTLAQYSESCHCCLTGAGEQPRPACRPQKERPSGHGADAARPPPASPLRFTPAIPTAPIHTPTHTPQLENTHDRPTQRPGFEPAQMQWGRLQREDIRGWQETNILAAHFSSLLSL